MQSQPRFWTRPICVKPASRAKLSAVAENFRDRFLLEFERSGLTKAELSRRSGVNYHTIDSIIKGKSLKPSADVARDLAVALGMGTNTTPLTDRLLSAFNRLDASQRELVVALAESLTKT